MFCSDGTVAWKGCQTLACAVLVLIRNQKISGYSKNSSINYSQNERHYGNFLIIILKKLINSPRKGMAAPTKRSVDGGALFAVRVQSFVSITRVAVQVRSEPVNYHGTGFRLSALAQCRGTIYLGARNLSRCRILIACRCACPGVRTITNLS